MADDVVEIARIVAQEYACRFKSGQRLDEGHVWLLS